MMKIAINGFGRIGRLFFHQALKEKNLDIIAINDLGNIENLAYLLKYDSIYGRFDKEIKIVNGFLRVDGKKIIVLQEKDPGRLPWKDLKIDIVVEATGVFESFEKASIHLTAGAKRVVITAPAKDGERVDAKTVLLGINDDQFKVCTITSNGSCTTNAVHPVAAIMAENPGIQKAFLNTIHAYTATQNLVDGPTKGRDFRRGRAASQNIIPSTTGAAISITRALSELKGKFDGIALRVPVVCGSVADFTFLAKRKTSVEEINDIFKKAAADSRWKNILKVTEDPIVSSDIIKEPYGAIIDLRFTKVVDGDLVKILSWYDNEFGYAVMLVQHVLKLAKTIS